ncbi:acyl-coenzyme A oxidase 3, peroxisomal-like [Wolffia australiana]
MEAPELERVHRRTSIIAHHLLNGSSSTAETRQLEASACVQYASPESYEKIELYVDEMRRIMDGHDSDARDWVYRIMEESPLFLSPRRPRKGRIFLIPNYDEPMEQQRELTMRRIVYLRDRGMYDGWLTCGREMEMRRFALIESSVLFDHSLGIKLGVQFFLWGLGIRFLGTKYHHDKWLRDTEKLEVKGCFAMTELGHGSNVRGIETVATYDSEKEEFIINTPCESAQKYWIGGAGKHANHTIIFAQLEIEGENKGVHAFAARIRDADGKICPNIRIADCGHKIGLNGIDNGRIWFDNLRIPRLNLLNSLSNVSPDGKYTSVISDPDQRFAALLAPLTLGRINITVGAVYSSKIALAIAIRYSLTRRAFSITPGGPEVPLLDYPSHQRRLLPLLAKTYGGSCAVTFLKTIYVERTPEMIKPIHVYSSAFKAVFTWQNMIILQECREACGGQGVKTENRVGLHKGEFDVQSTFEGDNNVLMQQVSKVLLSEYVVAQRRGKPFKGLGLEHMNGPRPVIPANLTSSVIRNAEFQIDLLRLRERDLLERFSKEVSDHQARGAKKDYAIVLSFQVGEELGRAFSDRAVLQTLLDVEAAAAEGPLKEVMALLRSMYVLIIVEEDTSFLRYGLISREGAAVVRREVATLCGELRPHALSIVSSLGIPSSLLCPLAFDWIDANSWDASESSQPNP